MVRYRIICIEVWLGRLEDPWSVARINLRRFLANHLPAGLALHARSVSGRQLHRPARLLPTLVEPEPEFSAIWYLTLRQSTQQLCGAGDEARGVIRRLFGYLAVDTGSGQ